MKPLFQKIALTLIPAVCGLAASSHGAGIESFAYPAGEVLTNKGSAEDAGFAGPWYRADNVDIVEGSLDAGGYPVLPTAGNRIFWNSARAFRDLDRVYSGETDDILYISFLRRESFYVDMVYSAFELFNGGTADKVDRVFALGALQNDSAGVDGIPYYERISARMNNVQDTVVHLGDRDQSSPVEFYVIKIELKANGADTVSIYRNPTSSNLGEPAAVATDLPEYPLIFDRLAFASYDNPNQLGFKTDIDEVRVGSTLAEVMVVDSEPEFWFGYAIAEGDWVETGAWLSRVNVRNAPWIWSEDLGKYLYINSEAGWVFFPK